MDSVEFGRRLREFRKKRGLEQWSLAELSGVQSSSISNFEHGKRKPSIDTIFRLAEVLMVSIDYLVGRSESPLSHTIVDKDGPDVARLLTQAEITAGEDFLNYAKERGGYVVDRKDSGDSSDPGNEPE